MRDHFERGHHFGPGGFGRHGFGRGGRGGFWDWGGDEGDHGRGGRRRVLDAAELRTVLLKLIADQPRHGYDLIRAIEELTGGSYAPSPGVVYPALALLQDQGFIVENSSEGTRKAFAATEEGMTHLAENAETVTALFARLTDMAAPQDRADGIPIRRAMHNLRAVLKHRLFREETDPETLHAIVDILDDAARKIERLP
ncbi:PadR family transcriptional regulator [Elstera cyanobacteriorum]|uniref:PadR family transcriptional regulator n=2 Tax=Elstera cyanobacteriorum TaxID=2022747 RepID=A0A255XQ43_9PROT|nr:PadR family transcriptional regulator [Elstera cyanobacteriorum]